jgi:hypothetical protein
MKLHQTWDDRYGLLNHAWLHYGIRTLTASFTAIEDGPECVLICNADITVTLPLAADHPGAAIYIKKVNFTVNPIVIRVVGTDQIDGANPLNNTSLAAQYDSVLVVSDGVSNWWILAHNP